MTFEDLHKHLKADVQLNNHVRLYNAPIEHIRELERHFKVRKCHWNLWEWLFGLTVYKVFKK